MSTFLPIDYVLPAKPSGYFKLQEGENRLRILSEPLLGWEDWQDNKPLRFAFDAKPEAPVDPERPIRHFWSMVVWNYAEGRLQILHLTQKSVQAEIATLANDEDFGDPREYDIKIIKEKVNGLTKYSVKPLSAKPVSKEIQAAYSKTYCCLEALLTGEDPWNPASKPVAKPKVQPLAQENDVEQRFRASLATNVDWAYVEEYVGAIVEGQNGKFSREQIWEDAIKRAPEFKSAYQQWVSSAKSA